MFSWRVWDREHFACKNTAIVIYVNGVSKVLACLRASLAMRTAHVLSLYLAKHVGLARYVGLPVAALALTLN